MAPAMELVVLLCAAVTIFGQPIVFDESIFESIQFYAGPDQSKNFGNCHPSDRLVLVEDIYVEGVVSQVQTKDFIYPPNPYNQVGLVIDCIKVYDQLKNGKNAEVKIVKGGYLKRFLTINFTSGRGDPIKYRIDIYAH